MRRLVPSLTALLLALGFVLAFPSLASAHDVLEKTTPSDGTSTPRMPSTVTLVFSEAPLAIGTQVIVTGPAGEVSTGTPAIDGRTVVQSVAATAPAGDYTVSYRVTSDDGHPVTGSFTFYAAVGLDGSTATAGSTVRAAEAAPSIKEQSEFVPVMLSIVGTVVLVGVVTFVLVRGRQRA